MPRVKPKTRLADRRSERAQFDMAMFGDIAAEVAAARDRAATATDTGGAAQARGALLGGDGLDMLDTLRRLQGAPSLKEQAAVLQKAKATLKSALAEPTGPDAVTHIAKSIELFLRFYLSPEGYIFRKSLDWIGEALSRATAVSCGDMQTVVVRCCEGVLARALAAVRSPDTPPAVLMSWVHSLNAMGLLDRDVPWLDDGGTRALGIDANAAPTWPLVPELGGGSLYMFVRISLLIFTNAANAVLEAVPAGGGTISSAQPSGETNLEPVADDDEGALSGSVAFVARFAECCGEVMRVLNIALKARRSAFIGTPNGSVEVSEMWVSLVNGPVLSVAARLLASNVIGKDVIASTALGIVCLQWISRHYFMNRSVSGAEARPYSPEVGVSQMNIIIAAVRAHYLSGEARPTSLETEAIAAGICPALAHVLGSLPLDAACGLFRASLSVYGNSTLMCRDEAGGEMFLHGGVYGAIMELCIHRAPEIQAAGMQTLEAWVNRVETIERARKQSNFDGLAGHVRGGELPKKICHACNVVSRSWSHPLKHINHLVPVVYQRLVDLMAVLDAHANARGNIGQNEDADIWWTPLIQDALAQPVHHRGRYQALTILLPRIGAVRFLQAHPQIIVSLTQSMRVRDVSSAATSLLGNILTVVKKSLPYNEFRNLWELHVVEAICASGHRMRLNAVDYLIPEMIKVDPTCCPRLINRIRKLTISDSDSSATEIKLFAIVHVVLQARLNNVIGQEVNIVQPEVKIDSGHNASSIFNIIATTLLLGNEESSAHVDVCIAAEGPLHSTELMWACLSQDVDLRLTAITLITSSQQALQPMHPVELDILRETIGYSMKTSTAEDRHRLLRAVRGLLLRLRETCRAATRDLKRLARAADAKKKNVAPAIPADAGKKPVKKDPLPSESDLLKTIATGHETCEWLSAVILGNLYPGSSSEREVVALELYLLVLDSLSTQDGADDAKLLRHFISADTIKALVNMLVSAWDRPRKLAAEALSKLPKPLYGVSTADEVGALVNWGCRLSGSSRQRESDAGALMLRVVMSIYCNSLGWNINVLHPGDISLCDGTSVPTEGGDDSTTSASVLESLPLVSRETSGIAAVRFVSGLCDLMAIRLQGLESLFAALLQQKSAVVEESEVEDLLELEEEISEDASPLCHGLFLVLKYALEEACSANLFDVYVSPSVISSVDDSTGDSNDSAWNIVLARILRLSERGLNLALSVVAEAQTDVSFAPTPVAAKSNSLNDSQTATADVGLSKGPTSVNSYMFLNTNSFMDNKLNLESSKKIKGTRAEVDLEDDIKEGVDENNMGGNVQRAVVGAWLLVKESSAFLARMVRLPAAINRDGENQDRTGALNNSEIEAIGSTLLDALGRLKHLGAISEAQQALQDICTHLLLLGEKNSYLCSLPSRWLESVLRRLENEQQVFILRRSAGFGFTFVALLKSEPLKIKSVLVPVALERLLCIANVGLLREGVMSMQSLGLPVAQLEDLAANSAIGWRACVHAINVIRLLVLDGVVGPRLTSFIAQATIVAVRGFVSSRWAVRNSAMMLFSAVIQRSVDVEKRESGGGKAATAVEFFQRYPSLFPFLLKELASICHFTVEIDTDSRPCGVTRSTDEITEDASQPTATHPSLFPILLLLSKFRAPTSSAPSAPLDDVAVVGEPTGSGGVELFVPLLESCCSNRVYQVREIAARALPSLTSLDSIPAMLVEKINHLIPLVANWKARTTDISSNEVHGKVLQLHCLVATLCKHFDGSTYRMGNNRVVYDGIRKCLAATVLVPFQYLLSATTSRDFGQLSSSEPIDGNKDVLLTGLCNPAVMTLLVRIINMLVQVIGGEENSTEAQNLLAALSSLVVRDIVQCGEQNRQHFPFMGTLREEAMRNLFPVVFRMSVLELTGQVPRAKLVPMGSAIFPFALSQCACRCASSGQSKCAVSVLLNMLDAPSSNSEVRRGVLGGVATICRDISPLVQKYRTKEENDSSEGAKQAASTNTDILSFFLRHDILLRLLHRSIAESEPPEGLLSIELLCQILRCVDSDQLPIVMDKTAAKYVVNSFQAGGWALWHLVRGPNHFSPVRTSLLSGAVVQSPTGYDSSRFMVAALDYLGSRHLYDQYLKSPTTESKFVAPTEIAACAIEVLGWSICAVFKKFTFESRVNTYTVSESKQMERTSALLNMWVDMIERSTDEDMPVFCRMSAVRSIIMSKVLLWTVEYGLSVLKAHAGPKVEKKVNGLVTGSIHNGEFSCRVWLVVLKLMQDDDVDIRSEMNVSISCAISALVSRSSGMGLDHYFNHSNLPPILRVSDTLSKRKAGAPDTGRKNSDDKTTASVDKVSAVVLKEQVALPADLEPSQGRSLEFLVKPLAMCVMWSLLCDRVPAPDVKSEPLSTGNFKSASAIAATYGDKCALRVINGVHIFVAHRGVKTVLESFHELSGGSIQPLMQLVMKECQNESSTQQIFEVDQANLHAESLIAAGILSASLGVVVNALPPSATLGLSKYVFARAEAAVSMLQLSLQRMSWLGGSSYQPVVFNYAYCALGAARMQRSKLPEATANEELFNLEKRLKTCSYQLVRRSDQLVSNSGDVVAKPIQTRNAPGEVTSVEDEPSWYSSLSRLVSFTEVESRIPTSDLGVESCPSDDIAKSRSQSVVSECDNTVHSETAHLRAPILSSNTKVVGLHPMLVYLLHDIITYDGVKPISGEQA